MSASLWEHTVCVWRLQHTETETERFLGGRSETGRVDEWMDGHFLKKVSLQVFTPPMVQNVKQCVCVCARAYLCVHLVSVCRCVLIAAGWCFIKQRWGQVSVREAAVPLLVKPLSVGFLLLFFLISCSLSLPLFILLMSLHHPLLSWFLFIRSFTQYESNSQLYCCISSFSSLAFFPSWTSVLYFLILLLSK